MAVANWLVRRTDLRRLAARELSVASGSCMPRIATAAWSTRMGSVSRGMRAKARTSASGMGRAAASSASNCRARRARGQLVVPEQVGHVLEGGLPRQLVDVVAAVGQATVPAVQVAETRLGGHHALETPDELAALGHR